jgi:HEAT repeat protein
VPALKGLLKDPEGEVREAAGFDLGRMGAAAQEAVPALIECLEDPEPRVRSQATRSLGELHLEPGLAVPALLRSLDRPGVPKSETIDALAQFGPEAKAAVPALCRVLEDQAESAWLARCGAICALETIGAEQELVIPALARELNDHHPAVRSMATNFLLKYHPAAAARAGLTAAVPHP